MMYLIKYTLTVQFSIKDYTIQLHYNNLLNMKSKPWVNCLQSYFSLNFYNKENEKKNGPKSQSVTEHQILRATNLRQFREFYTSVVGDVGDI